MHSPRTNHALSLALVFGLLICATTLRAQNCVLRWDPTHANPGFNGVVRALDTYNDGTGLALYAGGDFTTARGVGVNRIARWNGATWSPLGNGITTTAGTPQIFALEGWAGNGAAGTGGLFAAGTFTIAGSTSANRIARWNGVTWLACDNVCNGTTSTVFSLTATDDASSVGPAVYAGGSFNNAGCTTCNGIGKWDGATWANLGSGMLAVDNTIGTVYALLVSNSVLYAGGAFNRAGGVIVNYIAQWNGATWASVGGGVSGVAQPTVYALGVFDGDLVAGGNFTNAGGTPANCIARWNGTTWNALGTGTGGAVPTLINVRALTTWDDGQGGGTVLYVGGEFVTAGGLIANYVARWSGASWSALPPTPQPGQGMNAAVHALAVYNDGAIDALYVAGLFTTAAARTSERIARWYCIPLQPESCCIPGTGCVDLNFNQCQAAGGTSGGPGTTCAATDCPRACCLPDGTCQELPSQTCANRGGSPLPDGVICPDIACTGGCCLPDNSCVDTSLTQCAAQNGTFAGPNTRCANIQCPQACCFEGPICQNLLPATCMSMGGVLEGVGTNCATIVCTIQPQACCSLDGACTDLSPSLCITANGAPQGPGTTCATTRCTGACCLRDNNCADLTSPQCTARNGAFQGQGTQCANTTCPCPWIRPGDFTDDGHVDGADIPGFTAEMLTPDPPATPNFCRANFVAGGNPDILDDADTQAFVACLLDPSRCP